MGIQKHFCVGKCLLLSYPVLFEAVGWRNDSVLLNHDVCFFPAADCWPHVLNEDVPDGQGTSSELAYVRVINVILRCIDSSIFYFILQILSYWDVRLDDVDVHCPVLHYWKGLDFILCSTNFYYWPLWWQCHYFHYPKTRPDNLKRMVTELWAGWPGFNSCHG